MEDTTRSTLAGQARVSYAGCVNRSEIRRLQRTASSRTLYDGKDHTTTFLSDMRGSGPLSSFDSISPSLPSLLSLSSTSHFH